MKIFDPLPGVANLEARENIKLRVFLFFIIIISMMMLMMLSPVAKM